MCNYIVLKMTKEKEDGKYMHIISEVRSKDEKGFHLQEWLVMFTCSLGCSCDTRFITHRDSWCLAAFFPLFIHQNVHTGVTCWCPQKVLSTTSIFIYSKSFFQSIWCSSLFFFSIFHQIYTPHQNTIFSLVSVHFQMLRSVWYLISNFFCVWMRYRFLPKFRWNWKTRLPTCWRKVYSTCHESFSPGIWLIYPSPTCGPRCFQPLEMICSERPLSAWSTGANWLGVLTKKGIKISHKTFFQFCFWFIPLFIQFSLACRYLIWDEIHWHKIHHVRDCPVWDVEPDVPEGFVSLFSLR